MTPAAFSATERPSGAATWTALAISAPVSVIAFIICACVVEVIRLLGIGIVHGAAAMEASSFKDLGDITVASEFALSMVLATCLTLWLCKAFFRRADPPQLALYFPGGTIALLLIDEVVSACPPMPAGTTGVVMGSMLGAFYMRYRWLSSRDTGGAED